MWFLFHHRTALVVYTNGTALLYTERLSFCIALEKNDLKDYYTVIAVLVFFPMITAFIWLYYHIAALIWQHRNPLSTVFYKREDNSSAETSTSQVKSSETSNKSTNSVEEHLKKIRSRNRNVHVERKIRTFKIIVVLMIVFIICRLPYHIFSILKLLNTYTEPKHWTITYVFTGLVLLNCALNPFLYTFLNSTLNVCMKMHKILIKDFFCKVCCCCCTNAEFEEFEKENPFMVENFEQQMKASSVKTSSGNSKVNQQVQFRIEVQMQNDSKVGK